MNIEVAQLTARNQSLEQENDRLRQGKPTLSKREREVYLMIANGLTVSDIGEKLFLSAKTISTYRARLLDKFKLLNNADITMHAIRNRMITVELLPAEECMEI